MTLNGLRVKHEPLMSERHNSISRSTEWMFSTQTTNNMKPDLICLSSVWALAPNDPQQTVSIRHESPHWMLCLNLSLFSIYLGQILPNYYFNLLNYILGRKHYCNAENKCIVAASVLVLNISSKIKVIVQLVCN